MLAVPVPVRIMQYGFRMRRAWSQVPSMVSSGAVYKNTMKNKSSKNKPWDGLTGMHNISIILQTQNGVNHVGNTAVACY